MTGMELYQSDCASCHLASGAGGKLIGSTPSADLRPSALIPMYGADDYETKIANAILNGTDEDDEALDAAMPRWAGKLSANETADIVNYLLTLNSAPEPQSNLINGMELFQADCASCHLADGSGGKTIGTATSADLRQSALLPGYGAANFETKMANAILNGKDEDDQDLDSAMPRWTGKLTDSQVNDIVTYMVTLK